MTKPIELPSLEKLNSILQYDHQNGIFVWKKTNTLAGKIRPSGYYQIGIDGKRYYSHRLAWKLFYNEEPPELIDHIDGDKTNNKIENLRASSKQGNAGNSKRNHNNTSGYKGVTWHNRDKHWVAQIRKNGKRVTIGAFNDPKLAHSAYMAAATDHFGQFASDGVRHD